MKFLTKVKLGTWKLEVYGRAKLTDNQVREIRDRYIRFSKNANSVILAKEFGVSYTEICDIINNKTWKHIK